jgi:predicted dehydrogenase
VGAPIVSVSAVGTPVYSDQADIANARIEFANGCVANVTASRISLKSERKMRIFQEDAYLVVDFQERKTAVFRKRDNSAADGELFTMEEKAFPQSDALRSEIDSFLNAVSNGSKPVVTGEDGLRALETALQINEKVLGGLASSGAGHQAGA